MGVPSSGCLHKQYFLFLEALVTFTGGPFPFLLESTLFLFSFSVSFESLIVLTLLGRPCLEVNLVVLSDTVSGFDGDRVFVERVDIVAESFLRRRCEVSRIMSPTELGLLF